MFFLSSVSSVLPYFLAFMLPWLMIKHLENLETEPTDCVCTENPVFISNSYQLNTVFIPKTDFTPHSWIKKQNWRLKKQWLWFPSCAPVPISRDRRKSCLSDELRREISDRAPPLWG